MSEQLALEKGKWSLDVKETSERFECDFVQLEDGFFYYWPSGSGAYGAYQLRLLADELDRRNENYNAQIEEYFNQQKAR